MSQTDSIKKVLSAMHDAIGKENAELYERLTDEKVKVDINDHESFFYQIICPFHRYVSGLINTLISTDNNVEFILTHSDYLENAFRYWIVRAEGAACCDDKSRTIMRRLLNFYKDGTKIVFDYDAEYTFHLPKKLFREHHEIISFYEALKYMYSGNPNIYLVELQLMIAQMKDEEETND